MGLQIKFSHDYHKLWDQKKAKLVHVEVRDLDIGRDHALLEYDTKYHIGLSGEFSWYHLDAGKYLQLVFLGDKGIPFCTLRSYNHMKAEYYRRNIGETFDIVMKENRKEH